MTLLSLIREKIIITSNEDSTPIVFEDTKQLQINIDFSKPLVDVLIDAVEDWLTRIESGRERYSLIRIPSNDIVHGGVSIRFNNQEIGKLFLKRTKKIDSNGNRILASAVIQCKYIRTTDQILGYNTPESYYLDDRYFKTTKINGKEKQLAEVLNEVLPIRSKAIEEAICHIFQVKPQDILMETEKNRYVITTPYLFNDWKRPAHPQRFYKYVSIGTYINMLNNKTFRINSIVSQSDETESLYFGDFLCAEYENEIDKLRRQLAEEDVLVACFSSEANDPYMWEEFGESGTGVMLGFEALKSDLLTPVQYIEEDSSNLRALKNDIKSFKEQNIRIGFSEIDTQHRYIKNNKYSKENEWRLIHKFEGKLETTTYKFPEGPAIANYHDFPFTANILRELDMALVSVTIGPNARSYNKAYLIKRTKEWCESIDTN